MPLIDVHRRSLMINRKILSLKTIVDRRSTLGEKKGFTLIELLIVMSIIGVMVAAGSSSWMNAQQKGRDGKRKSDAKAVQQALETYLSTNGRYPRSTSGQIICNTGADNNKVIKWGDAFACNGVTYMQQIPKDPSQAGTPSSLASRGGIFDKGVISGLKNTARDITSPLASLFGKDNPQVAAAPPPERTALLNERVGFG
ncbi:MAG: prepilin-type N-terminal cleavage/methylation domain-containing protein, partial [Candidatus Curtissbacteria bacterium]|nr:prepilin-type N-terminal cleavage/methylation domain-containing protein [Candidatus Curtissbacteria bacterium]